MAQQSPLPSEHCESGLVLVGMGSELLPSQGAFLAWRGLGAADAAAGRQVRPSKLQPGRAGDVARAANEAIARQAPGGTRASSLCARRLGCARGTGAIALVQETTRRVESVPA